MNDLKRLFEEREFNFKRDTTIILKKLLNALKAIVQFLDIHEKALKGDLVWEAISFVAGDENEDDYIMMVGVISYVPGEKFTLSTGEQIIVTEDTVDYFRRVVRIGVPYEIAINSTVDEIVKFFETRSVELESDMRDRLIEAELEDKFFNEIFDREEEDFKLDELNDEQRKAFQLFSSPTGSKN